MPSFKRLAGPAALALSMMLAPVAMPTVASAAQVRTVVNGEPITNTDIQRRAAFIRLQQRRGNVQQMAHDEMVEQALRKQEMKRLRIEISEKQAEDAFTNFARSNGMSSAQMASILGEAGVTKSHFVEYIKVQMGWGQAIGRRQRGLGDNTISDAVRQIFKQGGAKATATEYVLEQVIFVVPERDRRALLAKRKREAQQLRSRYTGCQTSRELVRGMIDVTVRPLGRVLEPELPPEWSKTVKATSAGGATAVQETPRGVEFLGVCSTRVVNDDRVTELQVMQEQMQSGNAAEELNKKYIAELRAKARIVNP